MRGREPPRDRPPRLRRVLRVRRAAAAARPGRQARRRRRERAARGGHDRVLRGAQVRRRLGVAGRPGAAAVPAGRLPPARLRGLQGEVARGVGARPLAAARREPGRARRGLRGRDGVREAAAGAAGARRRGPGEDGDHDLGRRRAEPADRQGLLRSREAARLRGDGARGGLPAAGERVAADHPRLRAEDGRAARRARLHDDRRDPAGRPGDAHAALRRAPRARSAPARALPRLRRRRARVGSGEVTLAGDDLRPRHRGHGRARGGAGPAGGPARRGDAQEGDQGSDGGDQGPPRRLDDGDPRAHAAGRGERHRDDRGRRRRAPARLRAAAARAAARRPHGGLHRARRTTSRPPPRISSRCRSDTEGTVPSVSL